MSLYGLLILKIIESRNNNCDIWRFAFWWVACGCLWLSACSPPFLLYFHLSLFFIWPSSLFWTLKSSRVRCPHSAKKWFGRETQGPSVSPLEPPGPYCSLAPKVLPPFPTTVVLLTLVTHWFSQHSVYTVPTSCGGGGKGLYISHNIFTPPTPKPPRMPCMWVCCVFTNPQKKKKRAWRIVEEEPVL